MHKVPLSKKALLYSEFISNKDIKTRRNLLFVVAQTEVCSGVMGGY